MIHNLPDLFFRDRLHLSISYLLSYSCFFLSFKSQQVLNSNLFISGHELKKHIHLLLLTLFFIRVNDQIRMRHIEVINLDQSPFIY